MKCNEGVFGRKSFLESLNVKCGPNVIAGLWKENSLRLSNARYKITEKYKKCRQVLRHLRKQNKEGNSYTPGGFSTKIIPYDVDFTSQRSVSKIQTQDVCKTITFVSDVDVQHIYIYNMFITNFHNKWYFNEILLFFYCICNYCQYTGKSWNI